MSFEDWQKQNKPVAVDGFDSWQKSNADASGPLKRIPVEDRDKKPGLLKRFATTLYNKLVPETAQGIATTASRFSPGEMSNRQKAENILLKRMEEGKLTERQQSDLLRSIARREKIGRKLAPLPVPSPETWAEKGVDVGANIAGFMAQLAILRKGMPQAPESAIWEIQNLMSGGKPGMGAVSYAAFSGPGKVFKGTTKAAKAGRLATESAALAGVSGLESYIDTGEIDWKAVATSAALPIALRTPKTIKSLIKNKNPKVMKAVAEVHPELIERMMPMREAVGKKHKIRMSAKMQISKVTPVNIDTVNKTLQSWASQAKVLNATERKTAVSKLRKQQASIFKSRYKLEREAGTPRLQAASKARRASKGLKAKNPEIEPLKLTPEQNDFYAKKIEQTYPAGQEFQHGGASEALLKMQDGKIPTNYEFGLLEPIFGRDATEKLYRELIKKRPFSGWETPALAIQFFKTKFGLDIQTFRQARSLAVRHPLLYMKAGAANARAYISNKYAERTFHEIRNSPGYAEAEKLGWNFVGEAGYSSKRLEYYSLGLTERLITSKNRVLKGWGKLLEASERGAVAGINTMQKGLYDNAVRQMRKLNLTEAQQKVWLKNRAKTHNTFMKILRVPPGKEHAGLRKLQNAANYVLFSPSMTVSRPLSIKALVANKGSRQYAGEVIATNIASIFATTAIPAMVANHMRLQNPEQEPDVNGELNILDGNWGKIRKGKTVFDLSMGDAPFYRTLARIGVSAYMQGKQLATGQPVTEFKGRRVPKTGETFKRYLETRETAMLGFARTMATGKDWMGKLIPRFEAVVRAISPEIIEATVEAGLADGLWGSLSAFTTSTMAGGVSTYPVKASTTRSKFRDIIAKQKYNKDWDMLSVSEQNRLRSEHKKQFDMLAEKVRSERAKEPLSLEYIKEEELAAGKRITTLLSEPNQQWVEDIALGVNRRPNNWYLNDNRYNRYQELIAGFMEDKLSKVDFTDMDNRKRVKRVQIIVKAAKKRALGILRRESRER